MLGLFGRCGIDDATLDQHLETINTEAAGLQFGIRCRRAFESEPSVRLPASSGILFDIT